MILVTGGTGAIGGELLRLLSQAGIPRALSPATGKARHCRASLDCRRSVQTRDFDTRFRRCRDAIPAHQLLRRHD